MAINLPFRRQAVSTITNDPGCYVLCDLDCVPIYVGKSTDGIRNRVLRHLTSARSDIIANRQVDVWEIAYVWAYPIVGTACITSLEHKLYHQFNTKTTLMNGQVPKLPKGMKQPATSSSYVEPSQVIQVMETEEIAEKRDPTFRLPRQAEHYSQIVGHFLAVKNSEEIAGAIQAHFERLHKYHRQLLGLAVQIEDDTNTD